MVMDRMNLCTSTAPHPTARPPTTTNPPARAARLIVDLRETNDLFRAVEGAIRPGRWESQGILPYLLDTEEETEEEAEELN